MATLWLGRHGRSPAAACSGEISLPTYKVLLHHKRFAAPSLHLVNAVNEAMAQEIADELMDDTPDCVGVEVWEGEQRLYLRGEAGGSV